MSVSLYLIRPRSKNQPSFKVWLSLKQSYFKRLSLIAQTIFFKKKCHDALSFIFVCVYLAFPKITMFLLLLLFYYYYYYYLDEIYFYLKIRNSLIMKQPLLYCPYFIISFNTSVFKTKGRVYGWWEELLLKNKNAW